MDNSQRKTACYRSTKKVDRTKEMGDGIEESVSKRQEWEAKANAMDRVIQNKTENLSSG